MTFHYRHGTGVFADQFQILEAYLKDRRVETRKYGRVVQMGLYKDQTFAKHKLTFMDYRGQLATQIPRLTYTKLFDNTEYELVDFAFNDWQ